MYSKLFVSLDKIASFVKSVELNTSGTHTFGAGGKGYFRAMGLEFFFHFTCFIV